MKKITTTLALLLAVVTLTNCSAGGFSTGSSTGAGSSNNNAQGTGGDNTDPTSPTNPLNSIDLQGITQEPSNTTTGFGGALTFDFDKSRGEFIIMVPMPAGLLVMPSGSISSKYPDITFYGVTDINTGKMKLAVRVPVKYIIKGVSTLPVATLPNGNPLPAMPSGYQELPSLGLSLPAWNNTQIDLYIGVNAIGLYVTLPPNAALPVNFTIPVRNKNKTQTFGYLTYVGPVNGFAPGLFVSSIIPASVSRVLEDYFKL